MRRAVLVSDDSPGDGGSGSDGSGSGASREYESDASGSSEGDAGAARRRLVDDEAEESGDDEADVSGDDDGSARTFHGFMRLPLELRYRTWEAFCPDLLARGRLLQFRMDSASARHARAFPKRRVWTLKEWVTLPDQTESLRRVMAAHGESRAMALKAFPDTLSIDSGAGDGLVHFNRNDDVVFFNGMWSVARDDVRYFPGFANRVLNFAAVNSPWPEDELAPAYARILLRDLPNVKRMYCLQDANFYKDRDIRWCVSDYVHQYTTETFEKQPGLGENTLSVTCWPDVDNHPDFAKYQTPGARAEGGPPKTNHILEERGIETWPMVLFQTEEDMARYRWLQDTKHMPNCEELVSGLHDPASDAGTSQSETEEDEYESDGIDDAEIIEDDDSSEDEIIPRALSDGRSSADEGDAASARFSSPEPAPRPPKRRVVTDSDDDDDEPAEPRAKRARTGRAIAADSDDDDDAGSAAAPVAAISDSESDGDGGAKVAATSGEFSSSEDDSDEDSVPEQRMSLAERLQMSREAIPIPSDGEGGSVEEDDEDEDGEVDSEGEEDDDEDDDDDSGDELMDGMAAESDGEGEGESDDGW